MVVTTPMDCHIRQGTLEEKDRILSIQSQSLQKLSTGYDAKQIASLISSQEHARDNSEILLVAAFEDRLLGFAAIDRFRPCITGIFVVPKYARQGIGTQLLSAIEQLAIERDDKRLEVMSSLSGVDFYYANGYQYQRESGFYALGKV